MTALQLIALGRKLSNIYADLSAPICKQYGINQTGFDILLFCANNPEHNTARDICAIRGIKSGIASVAVESLMQSGLLERREDARDRRIRRLIPTAKAAPILSEGRRMQKHFADTLRSGITPEETAAFQSVTEKLVANMECFGREEKKSC